MIYRGVATVEVPFECEAEVRSCKEFQSEGHHLSPLVRGDKVYILTYRAKGQQLLRVQGNTDDAALVAMRDLIPDNLYALWAQGQIQSDAQRQLRLLHEDRNKLAEFLAFHYAQDELPYAPTVVEVAIRLLTRERSRWWVRLRKRFTRNRTQPPPPAPTPRVDPPEAA